MAVEEIIRKIRSLPSRLRFHLLFSAFISLDKSSQVLSLIDVHGEMLAELSTELNALPSQVRLVLIASELRQSLVG